MSRSTFTAVAAVVSFFGAAMALFAPRQLAAFYGIELDAAGVGQEQLLGAAYLGIGLMNWLAKDVRDAAAQRAMAIGNTAGWTASLVVVVGATVLGSASSSATIWSLAASQAFFAAAWAYYAIGRVAEVRATA